MGGKIIWRTERLMGLLLSADQGHRICLSRRYEIVPAGSLVFEEASASLLVLRRAITELIASFLVCTDPSNVSRSGIKKSCGGGRLFV